MGISEVNYNEYYRRLANEYIKSLVYLMPIWNAKSVTFRVGEGTFTHCDYKSGRFRILVNVI